MTTVLFLGGLGRSGTTLIERVLARAEGVHALGELVFLWERALGADERCGCGEAFSACPFWRAVGARAFGGWDRVDAGAMRALQGAVDRNRYIPFLLAPRLAGWLSPSYAARRDRYAAALSRIYAAVAGETGASVLVDSSKHASTAALLRHVEGIDARVVQVVRDPCGVAYSWSKVVARPDATDGTSTMARLGPVRASLRWLAYDAVLELVRRPRRGGRVRYEDFVADPGGASARLLAFAGHRAQVAIGAGEEGGPPTVDLGTDHTVAGNPLRFRTGPVRVLRDDEWRERLPARDRRVVDALTWPLRAAYGYR